MNLEKLLQKAKDGDMAAQYDLAEYYGKLIKNSTDEKETYDFSRQAIFWLKQAAEQGYAPAVDAIGELSKRQDSESDSAGASDTGYNNKKNEEGDNMSQDNSKSKKNGRVNILLACMLTVSMVINIFLLIYAFGSGQGFKRKNKETAPAETTPPVVSASVAPEVTKSPAPVETTPPVTAEPSVEPTEEPFWLDLSQYTDLEVVPEESDIFDDYEYYKVTSNSNLNMRSGPSTDYKKISDGIPSGTKVGAVSKRDGWFLVFYDGKYAWVSGNYLGE